jgi:hypothetical protein
MPVSRITILVLLLAPFMINAQSWSWAINPDGNDNENCSSIIHLEGGRWAIGGAFKGAIDIGSWSATSAGGSDYLLAVYDENQNLEWAISGGGSEDDFISSIDQLPNGDLIFAGGFWFELPILDTVLTATGSPRALFLACISEEGALRWAQQYSGDGIKEISGITALENGNLAISGHYEKSLLLGDTTLLSGTADGTTYCFAAQFAADGQFQWIQQGGLRNDTRATAITTLPNNSIVIGGFFNDTTLLAGQQFISNAFDRDVFLVAYDESGAPLWARKAGGVIDDELNALATDEEGNIYATGSMIGVLTLSDDISIETQDSNTDFFLLKYAADGTPLFGRALGSDLLQQGLVIDVAAGLVVVGGSFQGNISFDGLSASSPNIPRAFIAGFNTEGEGRWLVDVPADLLGVTDAVAVNENRLVLAGGSFGQTAEFDDATFTSMGLTSLFVGQLLPALTGETEPGFAKSQIAAFPNPLEETLFFDLPDTERGPLIVYLYDANGALLRQAEVGPMHTSASLNVKGLAAGTYHWVVSREGKILNAGSVVKL